jgi:hypothetical protein
MAIVINGSGTVTGISVGGLPDGVVDSGTVAADVATQAELDAKVSSITDNGNANAITIDSNENVGIGASVGESSQGSNSQALFVGPYSALINSGAYESCNLVENAYIGTAASDTWKYRETSEAARHEMRAGYHYLKVGVSGSADADITWVDGIVIKPNGGGGASTTDISMGAAWSGDGGGKTDFQTGANNGVLCRMSSSTTGSNQRMWFVNSNGLVGSVSTNGSATVFATSSDYRLKENVNYDWDATTKIKQLKPARFNFIADDTTVIDGFIAHEVQEVVPEAVTGTKDEMRDEEYEVTPAVMDGEIVVTPAVMGTRSVPYYQGIDQAKLVPLLVKTIQELEARITALEA